MTIRKFNIALVSALAMAGSLLPTSCSGGKAAAETNDTAGDSVTSVDRLRARLSALTPSGKVAFGHHDDPVYGHAWNGEAGRSDVLETAGDYPAVMSWDLGMIEMGDSANLDGVSFDRMRREVIAQDERGGFSTFSWHLRNPADTTTDSWFISDTTVVSRILNDSIVSARFDLWLNRLADFFNSLQRPDGTKVPVIFRPWHEHTGSWFWWGAGLCTPSDYVALWQRTRQGLDKAGVDNLLWAYSPDRVADSAQYLERYPGDDYVDILGVDVYHFGGEQGVERYREDASRSLAIARAEAKERGKIAAFSETGSEGLPMAGWWTDVLLPLLREQPVSYVVVWRNAHDKPTHYYAPFAGEPSADSFKAFHDDETTIFAREMAEIK